MSAAAASTRRTGYVPLDLLFLVWFLYVHSGSLLPLKRATGVRHLRLLMHPLMASPKYANECPPRFKSPARPFKPLVLLTPPPKKNPNPRPGRQAHYTFSATETSRHRFFCALLQHGQPATIQTFRIAPKFDFVAGCAPGETLAVPRLLIIGGTLYRAIPPPVPHHFPRSCSRIPHPPYEIPCIGLTPALASPEIWPLD